MDSVLNEGNCSYARQIESRARVVVEALDKGVSVDEILKILEAMPLYMPPIYMSQSGISNMDLELLRKYSMRGQHKE